MAARARGLATEASLRFQPRLAAIASAMSSNVWRW